MLLGVAACSATPPGGTPTTTDPAAPTTNTETATPTDAAPQTIDTVGLMVQDLSNPFFLVMKNAMEAQGQADGFTVNTQDGQQDLGQQNSQIDAYIAQKIDLLLINAVDSQGIGTAVQRALDAGIVVVAVDVDAAGSQAVVMTNNVEAGTLSCTALADKLGGSGNVAIIDGTPITSVQDRIKGCEEVLASEYPGITVVAKQSGKNDVASGQTIATDMLTAHPEIQGIFALNDPTARGAVLALQQAQRTDIWVTGVDGSPDAVTEMNQPNSPFWATPAQDPAGMVVKAYEVGRDIIANGPPAEADRVTLMAPSLVTQDNLADYKGWQV
jgi:ribose transport system substrate-binding protein